MTLELEDPPASAEEAGLRYVNDTMPGVRRRRAGKAFTYLGTDGERVTDPDRIAWFKRLAIPPAWTEVWISPIKRGHIQATGVTLAAASSTDITRAGGRCATRQSTAA